MLRHAFLPQDCFGDRCSGWVVFLVHEDIGLQRERFDVLRLFTKHGLDALQGLIVEFAEVQVFRKREPAIT